MNLDFGSIYNSIAANLIWFVLGLIVLTAKWWFAFLSKRYAIHFLWKLFGAQAVIFTLVFLASVPASRISLSIAFALSFLAQWYVLRHMYAIGLQDSFSRTQSGIDFEASLKLAHSSISFLGIGAHKLTRLDEFEAALKRCSQGSGEIRLLLSPPQNPLLLRLARRNGVEEAAYSKNVESSLKKLAQFKKDGFNIQVRHYKAENQRDYQQFRLLIVDDKICIVSWTVWNQSLGADNPQIVLGKRAAEGSTSSLASPFMSYFESVWEDPSTTVVDLEKYL